VIRQDCPYHGEGDPEGSNAISSVPDNPALPPVVIIAGPTASGKSALALDLAELFDGTIINADALQIYRDLPILTAWPEAAAMARVPHLLYGWLDAAERGSAGRWREAGLGEIAASHRAGRLPIVVGGTGLYLRALREGLAAIPPIPPEVRAKAAALYGELGGERFRAELGRLDPESAALLPSGDRHGLAQGQPCGIPLAVDPHGRVDHHAPRPDAAGIHRAAAVLDQRLGTDHDLSRAGAFPKSGEAVRRRGGQGRAAGEETCGGEGEKCASDHGSGKPGFA